MSGLTPQAYTVRVLQLDVQDDAEVDILAYTAADAVTQVELLYRQHNSGRERFRVVSVGPACAT